jgi:hypothetical protein
MQHHRYILAIIQEPARAGPLIPKKKTTSFGGVVAAVPDKPTYMLIRKEFASATSSNLLTLFE